MDVFFNLIEPLYANFLFRDWTLHADSARFFFSHWVRFFLVCFRLVSGYVSFRPSGSGFFNSYGLFLCFSFLVPSSRAFPFLPIRFSRSFAELFFLTLIGQKDHSQRCCSPFLPVFSWRFFFFSVFFEE